MSGTSLDGMDIIYVNFMLKNSWSFTIRYAETLPYDTSWKSRLKELTDKTRTEIEAIDIEYSKYLGDKINAFIEKHEITNIDFISSHGHTALHQPEKNLTLQIGNLQDIANITNTKVICDFRVQDVKFGGQGAPLVPVGDRLLFYDYEFCLNLGGFANVSFESNTDRVAFDVCPVNIVLNHYVSKLNLEYDDKGKIAESGIINFNLLERLNQLQFYKQSPPKSLGLEWVQYHIFPIIDNYAIGIKDILRTFVEHCAMQISKILNVENSSVLITGGGAYNTFLIRRIKELSVANIIIPSSEIVEFKEALIFGFLGVLKERDEINCLKSVTGAKTDHSTGKILLPNT